MTKASTWIYVAIIGLLLTVLIPLETWDWQGGGSYVSRIISGGMAVLTVRSVLAAVRAEIRETQKNEIKKAF